MRPGMRNRASEAFGQLGIDLETAQPDSRTQRCAYFVRSRTQANHRAHAYRDDICQRSAPTGMKRAGNVAIRVDHEDRHAIGAENSQSDSWRGRHHPIALRARPGITGADRAYDIAVDL